MAEDLNKQIVEARRAYKKAWREANKDKVKASNRRFYERYAAKLKAKAETAKADTVSS